MSSSSIPALLLSQPPAHSLLQPFYTDPEVFGRELDRIFLKSWLYVGHVSEIPNKGDYLLFRLAEESVIIVNRGEGQVSGLINVCRHRGSRICTAPRGHEKMFVCRYHGWTYQLDGKLRGAGHTGGDFDKSKYGLKQVQVRLFHGMIFINFDPHPISFDDIERDLDEPLKPYDLAHAKVAHKQNYPIAANWKLAIENYCECYHCAPSHPEYSVAHGRAIPNAEMRPMMDAVLARSDACGLSRKMVLKEWKNSGGVGNDRAYDRYVLMHGHVTGSQDGKPVAPLMGTIRDYDGGTNDMHIGPMTFYLAYCDHVVVYRFTPTGLESTDCEISWLVRGDAVEGKDYDLNRLKWLWDVTTIADKRIIEDNAAGMKSRFYEPGPYTPMEDFTRRFIEWYLDAMK
jgi:Rieske 2Fe-2S family protein